MTPLGTLAVGTRAAAILPGVPVFASDSAYTTIDHAWFLDFLAWEWEAERALGIVYTPESFDCEDFALGFSWAVSRAAAKAGVKAAPLVARIVVITSLDPPARHELIAVATDRGIFVVEPQANAGPFRVWPIETYPKQILSVVFGDYQP